MGHRRCPIGNRCARRYKVLVTWLGHCSVRKWWVNWVRYSVDSCSAALGDIFQICFFPTICRNISEEFSKSYIFPLFFLCLIKIISRWNWKERHVFLFFCAIFFKSYPSSCSLAILFFLSIQANFEKWFFFLSLFLCCGFCFVHLFYFTLNFTQVWFKCKPCFTFCLFNVFFFRFALLEEREKKKENKIKKICKRQKNVIAVETRKRARAEIFEIRLKYLG